MARPSMCGNIPVPEGLPGIAMAHLTAISIYIDAGQRLWPATACPRPARSKTTLEIFTKNRCSPLVSSFFTIFTRLGSLVVRFWMDAVGCRSDFGLY